MLRGGGGGGGGGFSPGTLGGAALPLQRGDSVPDVVLHAFPGARPQHLWLRLQTQDAVLLLGHPVLVDEAHHVPLHGADLRLVPLHSGAWGGADLHLNEGLDQQLYQIILQLFMKQICV